MLVTESGMVIEVRPVQPEKAWLPMLVTESGMVMSPLAHGHSYSKEPLLIIPMFVQPEKTLIPMLVTESGMVIEVSPVQPLKA